MSSERQAVNKKNPWWGEHVHRYDEVIKEMTQNDILLDIACGTGFGSDLLAQHTTNVVIGGDIAQEAIEECQQRWNRKNLEFALLDGTKLPYTDNYFDKIVSFETIEHTTEYLKMLSEFSRVLKPNGTAYISTPNFPINSPTGVVTNPFHTQEFTYEELSGILNEVFVNVIIYGQKYARYDRKDSSPHFGKTVETVLLQRGIRKIPMSIQDGIMQTISGNPLYPEAKDYDMVIDHNELMKCKTFFAVCKNE